MFLYTKHKHILNKKTGKNIYLPCLLYGNDSIDILFIDIDNDNAGCSEAEHIFNKKTYI